MTSDDKILITGCYIRVSTEEQAKEGFSINAQTEKLKQYAFARGWIIHDFYIDEAKSGKDLEGRPDVLRLLKDVVDKKIDNVLVYKIDRLTRSMKNLIELIELFSQENCAFNSLMESIDTTSATGRMFIKIIGIFAEFERENLAERVSFGFEQKALEGNYNGHSIYGYDYTKGTQELLINKDEAKIVKDIFAMYLKGKSMTEICDYLIETKVPTKRGGSWYPSSMLSILTNPLYIGKIRYKDGTDKGFIKDTDKYENIIDKDVFNNVQRIIGNRKKYTLRHYPKANTYFLTFLSCSKCGKKLHSIQHRNSNGKDKNLYVGYRCPNIKMGTCDCSSISQPKVEKAFVDLISKYDEFTANKDNLAINDKRREENEKREDLIKRIDKGKQQLDKLKNMFINEQVTIEEYREFSAIWNEKIKNAENELFEIIDNETEELSAEVVKNIVANFRNNWSSLSNEEKKEFLTNFVSDIKIQNVDKKVAITDISFNNGIGLRKKITGLLDV